MREMMAYYNISLFEANKACTPELAPNLAEFPTLSGAKKKSFTSTFNNDNKKHYKITSPILKKRKNIHNTSYDKKAHNECLFIFDNGNSVKSVLDSKLNNKNNDEDGFVSDTSAGCEGGETTPYNKFDKDVKNSGDIFKRELVSYKNLNIDVVTSSDEESFKGFTVNVSPILEK
ncbi:hypothetical protein HHI36_024329 [Cryptolaemus montrouzieri]|uniref:Uncharacterized protein n=1 Tax=Cryptolaemus montrouzieri TaxID=559131 RepID=A0ABD2NP93_9CUCU